MIEIANKIIESKVNNEWVIGKGITLPDAHAELKKAGVDLWK